MSVFKNLTKWQNYAHYALLALGIAWVMDNWQFAEGVAPYWKLLQLIVALFVLDTAVHALFAALPGKLRWSD